MDTKALFTLTNGLYLLTSSDGLKAGGCIVNTLEQVTSSPARLIVAVNKDNYTSELIAKSGVFHAVVLTQETEMNLIAGFGFRSGRDVDKFAGYSVLKDMNGVPYIMDSAAARFSLKVAETVDCGSHMLFLGDLVDAEVLNTALTPMTYAYYHAVKKGTTPKNAPSYQEEKQETGFRCKICGYIEHADSLPDDFVCPVCGASRALFEAI